MVRSEETPLNDSDVRRHLTHIIEAGVSAASGPALVSRALTEPTIRAALAAGPVRLVAAGKVANPMTATFLGEWPGVVRHAVVAATCGEAPEDSRVEHFRVGHPVPDPQSAAAGVRALEIAREVPADEVLLVLLSGGASAALAVPVDGLTLDDKVEATDALLRGGVAIDAINCVRKHLSAIKGGRLAAATRGAVVTLAISDVVAPVPDDPAVIGSGPTAPDPTRFEDALAVADGVSVRSRFPRAARHVLERGCRGELPETPKPGAECVARSRIEVIGSRLDALRGAATAAEALGYDVATIDRPVVGDARQVAPVHLGEAVERSRHLNRPACVLSAGETTVRVTGTGRGGRNQEFVLAVADRLAHMTDGVTVASIGTDGVDGPTDAAGAFADSTTVRRAEAGSLGCPDAYLDNNDSNAFFAALGDVIVTGPTQTNVGDLQIVLVRG